MHIAVLSDHEASGGANIAAFRLTEGFAAAGHRVTRIYQRADADDPRWDTRVIPSLLATHTLALPRRAVSRLVPEAVRVARHQRHSERRLGALLEEMQPDVVSVQNLHIGRWSVEMIRAASHCAPAVCTLHDTWTLTGRCVFPGSCEKYISGCDDQCPTADEYPSLAPEKIAAEWRLRQEILGDASPIAAVVPSDWLGRVAAAGLWRPRPIFKIPYVLDLECFSPIDRGTAKRVMGFDAGDRVILACASELSSPRKGIRLLFDALAAGIGQRTHLLLLGMRIGVPPIENVVVHQLGYVTDDRFRAIAFNAADVFVHSAIADNAPLTVMESLACGTPVVAFPVDGLPETTVSGTTGWLAAGVSSGHLRETLGQALDDLNAGMTLRLECREFAAQRYEASAVVAQYESVFHHMMSGAPTAVPLVRHRAPQPGPSVAAGAAT